ncbi:hypothetical protein ciss_14640 [Carboxydothermus islandicus]|uniref:Putative Se/S carrier protein-like domain-containing protein n=1 Tax=Carboxydothermus islandicus TaxID=661089 RepID=A0A1L8D382_9THEO|nr:DUF3343 domain-containing protein [Carboxydothermus islandicus]GAV25531.1 hypothetical protein ciss_14640 [Carboxydothermus islandicus]
MTYSVILFDNLYQVLCTKKLLENLGIKYEILPVPFELKADCGSCIFVKNLTINELEVLLNSHNIIYSSIETYHVKKEIF